MAHELLSELVAAMSLRIIFLQMKEFEMAKTDSEIQESVLRELDAAREAARLKLHLLSMDARRTWDDLEKKFQAVQKDLGERGEKVGEASAATARDLAHSIRKFIEKF